MSRTPHILVSNDDGYLAPGLLALVNALRPLGKITVVSPEQNHSGASNSLTLSRPLSIHRVAGGERDGFLFVNGTPTDCVHMAMTGFLHEKPDLVVSGISQGENMGEDVLYSGTVAAAIEGVMFGVPGVRSRRSIEAGLKLRMPLTLHAILLSKHSKSLSSEAMVLLPC